MRAVFWVPACLALVLAAGPVRGQGLVVVELFTSEGCSSCPPAEAWIAGLREESGLGEQFYYLQYHVDYWDHLGWKDPYALPESVPRHKAYARLLSPTKVYTPQAVINGAAETLGSSENQLPRLIERARQAPVPVLLQLGTPEDAAEGWTVSYTADGVFENAQLLVAVVENGLTSAVTAGENEGSVFTHDNVVRWFTVVDLEAAGEVRVKAPWADRLHDADVVALAQDKASLHILGAARVRLVRIPEKETDGPLSPPPGRGNGK